jgi:hypothetical protein
VVADTEEKTMSEEKATGVEGIHGKFDRQFICEAVNSVSINVPPSGQLRLGSRFISTDLAAWGKP